ncbi:hypothetical protein [Jannaschia formosa]|uniref:hypothetical protein n=1 Tax=Jannaschia formosa TaxID=2259592 RepID=UPI000E1C0B97|nr:hypothetical protein [Jannaschia formosa]TFL19423.1 hypothetical protein DR046_05750 [Jannaschia formosa]
MRWLLLLPLLSACAQPVPLTPAEAEAACRAELARDGQVSTSIGIGIGSGGPRVRGGLSTSTTLGTGTPEQRLAACIQRRIEGRGPPPRVGIAIGRSIS